MSPPSPSSPSPAQPCACSRSTTPTHPSSPSLPSRKSSTAACSSGEPTPSSAIVSTTPTNSSKWRKTSSRLRGTFISVRSSVLSPEPAPNPEPPTSCVSTWSVTATPKTSYRCPPKRRKNNSYQSASTHYRSATDNEWPSLLGDGHLYLFESQSTRTTCGARSQPGRTGTSQPA